MSTVVNTLHAAEDEEGQIDLHQRVLIVRVRDHFWGIPPLTATTRLLPWLQRYREPSPLPTVPSWVRGLLAVQGQLQLIVDLGAFWGLTAATPQSTSRLVFLEQGNQLVGLLVDAEYGMKEVLLTQPPPTPARHGEIASGRITSPQQSTEPTSDDALPANQPIAIIDPAQLMDRLAESLQKSAPVAKGHSA